MLRGMQRLQKAAAELVSSAEKVVKKTAASSTSKLNQQLISGSHASVSRGLTFSATPVAQPFRSYSLLSQRNAFVPSATKPTSLFLQPSLRPNPRLLPLRAQKPHPYIQWAIEQLALLDPKFSLLLYQSDIAGTIVNKYCTLPLIIFAQIFEKRGFKLTPEQITGPMGLEKIQHIRHLLDEIKEEWFKKYGKCPDENDAITLNAEFEKLLFEKIADPEYTELTPYTSDIIHFIQQSMKFASTSGYVRKAADLAMTDFFRFHQVDASTTSNEVIGGKRIAMILENMRKLNIPLELACRTFFVSDAQRDIQSARSVENLEHMPWLIGIRKYSAHVGVISNEHADLLPPGELELRREKAGELLSDAHIVINDMSEIPLAMVAIRKAVQNGLKPATTKRLELVYPDQALENISAIRMSM
jgi:phosphonoacetaldehyde hydrolase